MAFPGIVVPALVVRDIAEVTIKALVDSSSTTRVLVGQLVRSLATADQDSFVTALHSRPGKARLAFALDVEEDWQVVVMMTGTRPAIRTIGDDQGVEEDPLAVADLSADLSAFEGVTLPLAALPTGIPARGRIRLGDEVAIYVKSGSTITLPYRGIGGTAAVAHALGDEVVFHQLLATFGWDEYCAVRVDVLGPDAFFNEVLSTILKGALLRARDTFDVRGLTIKQIDESALMPRPIHWPAHLLNRTLTLDVHRAFTVPEELGTVTGLDITLTAEEGPHPHVAPTYP